jgi:RsiW-degrading membrane proteinase PrsW (M82 family)
VGAFDEYDHGVPERAVSWDLLAVASVLPLVVALAVAWPFWKRNKVIAGNTAGLAAIFLSCLLLGGAEYVEAIRFRYWCEGTATGCKPSNPSDFVRMALFGFIAMFQAMVLYTVSALRERRAERSQYEARWR